MFAHRLAQGRAFNHPGTSLDDRLFQILVLSLIDNICQRTIQRQTGAKQCAQLARKQSDVAAGHAVKHFGQKRK